MEVDSVLNQVVVKTTTAAAQVVAEAIDNLFLDNVIASLAGDNVVLIISSSEEKAKIISKNIENVLG